ncbi:MAG: substrate-binding domain-containing protein [Oryzomonas sp.]|uniref:substrate-binding domain-containing protein n=1 Tax=Oryzomonas sp. TaxID=2855186 RepID=UPI00283B8FA4|nr:substrate-binding domain-containing protein [Oryzomonas sp.]MDR3580497.1 substrate-binding domain-containing protein [Oryzomonas sp.]
MDIFRYFLVLLLLAFSVPATASEPIMASGCSISNVGYLNDLVKAYEKETGQKILIRGGGSIVGLTELGADKVDFAASCKSAGPKDSANLRFIPVAWDGLVFIVNPANPVSNIIPRDVKGIYEGKIGNWKDLGGANLPIKSYISSVTGMGGIGETLAKYFLNGKWPQTTVNSSMQASSVAIWEQLVEKTPEGFASTGFDSARTRKVKMLAVNGVAPTKATIISGKYPYKRYLYLVATKDAKPEVNKFIKFALSKKGQKLIASYGIPALAEMK